MKKIESKKRFRVIAPAYPAFNIYSGIARKTTALGPVIIGTMANQLSHWDVEIIDENNYRKYGPRDAHGFPDHTMLETINETFAVGLYGGLSSTIPRLFNIAALYKKRGIITIAGGQHFIPENFQETLDNGIDYIIIGEGELTIIDLLEILESGQDPSRVPGIAFLREGKLIVTAPRQPITDFDPLPLPDFSLLHYAKLTVFPINWIRGCGMDCEFCTVKGRPRPSSAIRILRQVAALVENFNAQHFFMVDDLFGHHRGNTLELCRLLADYQKAIARRLDFTVQIRLDRGKDAEMLKAMRKANINTVAIGFESPIPEELEAMNKKVNPEDMITLARKYHKAGFLVHGMFIFGYPLKNDSGFTLSMRQRVHHFKTFIRKARLDTIQVLLPVPLPGTELTARLKNRGRIYSRDLIGWEYYDGNFPLFQPDKPLSAEEMHIAVRQIMGRFYQFRYLFIVAINIIAFPSVILPSFNIKLGWRRWYRSWRNALKRFGGWIIVKNWTQALKQGSFRERLRQAGKTRSPGGKEDRKYQPPHDFGKGISVT